MRLHPRYFIVREASAAITNAVHAATEKHDLTLGEVVSILTEQLALSAKYLLRVERHPDDPCRKADEAPKEIDWQPIGPQPVSGWRTWLDDRRELKAYTSGHWEVAIVGELRAQGLESNLVAAQERAIHVAHSLIEEL